MSKARELAELSRTVSDSADAVAITIDSSEDVSFSEDIKLGDGKKAIFGASSDLSIYHDGSASFISDQGTGHLKILAGDFRVNNAADNAQFISAVNGAEVNLYHNNALKLATTSTGITVGNGSGSQQIYVDAGAGWADLKLNSDATNGGSIYFNDGADAGQIWYYHPDNTMRFHTDGTEAFRLTAAQDMYFGQTSGSAADVGIILQSTGNIFNTVSGGTCAFLRRNTSDGEIIRFSKDSTTVGSIGTANSGDLYIGNDDTSLLFAGGSDAILPRGTAGATRDAAIDLGLSAHRFKDLYLSGIADASNFKISGAQGTDGQVLTSTGSGVAWEDASSGGGTAGIVSSANATAMTIDSNEKIGVTLTNPGDFSSNDANNLVVGGSGSNGMTLIMGETNGDTARLDFRSTKLTGSFANIYTYIEVTSPFGNSPHDQMIFAVQDEEAMRIIRASSSEYVLIGKSSANLDTSGCMFRNGYETTWTSNTSQYPLNVRTNGSYVFEVKGTGVISSSSTSISSISDVRVKENIVDLETGLTQIMALQPRRFDFKDGEGSGQKNVAGFVAKEVEPVLPDLIDVSRHNTITDCKAIKMGDMIPTMVKAMQEQQALIESLTNRLAALEQ